MDRGEQKTSGRRQKGQPPRQDAPGAAIGHIRDLTPDPANRRAHNPRNLGMIVEALHHVGAARSIVIDEDNVILAGNGVTEAAAEAGLTKLRVIDAAGDEIVAVRRTGLTAEQKRALAIYDNRAGELATWNTEQLAADMKAGLDLKPFFFEEELAALLKDGTDQHPVEFTAVDETLETEHTCPKCGYEWSGKG